MTIVRSFVFPYRGVGFWIAEREDAKVALTLDYGKRFEKLKIDSADAVRSGSEACWHESPESAVAELLEVTTRKRAQYTPTNNFPKKNRRALD
jgi:hypothetical protein